MSQLIIRRPIDFPSFGASKWRKQDHDTPLSMQLTRAKVLVYLEEEKHPWKRDVILFPSGRIELHYAPAPPDLVQSLSRKGTASATAAEAIYDAYVEAHTKFEALLYSAGKVRYLMRMGPESMTNFFTGGRLSRGQVEWSVDGTTFTPFQPKLTKPRGRNPLYTAAQLVTPVRWRDMQRAADNGTFPEGELLELYRIRGKAGWRELRAAAIEASIISETLLRAYGLKALKESGFSNNKIKRLRDELTFNNLLNIVLPLSLGKTDLRRVQAAIDAVDRLRGIRNDLVHGNIAQKDVEAPQVEQGIDGAIALVRFLQSKLA
ncbi:MAG TPA: hypothetical protein VF017_15980 [Thermoanaerobaculia bacterium]|nr:hypothetical protein [Thermoanaerobaculia bacterium]